MKAEMKNSMTRNGTRPISGCCNLTTCLGLFILKKLNMTCPILLTAQIKSLDILDVMVTVRMS